MARKKKNRGWIKLHRSIQDSPIWSSDESFNRRDAWIDILMMVNHEQRTIVINGHKQIIEAGQRWTSVRVLAERWKWSRNRVMRYLDLLVDLDMITLHGTPNGTLLSVKKYGFYQSGWDTDGDTNGYTDEDTDGDTDGDETRTKKNYIKNDKEKKAPPFESSDSERKYQ